MVSRSPSAAVASAMPESGMQVVDMRGRDEPVHRGVDRRRGAAEPVPAVVEGGNHLVLAFDAGIALGELAQPSDVEDRAAVFAEGCEVTAGALTHISSTWSPVTGSVDHALAEVFPPAWLVLRGSAPSR